MLSVEDGVVKILKWYVILILLWVTLVQENNAFADVDAWLSLPCPSITSYQNQFVLPCDYRILGAANRHSGPGPKSYCANAWLYPFSGLIFGIPKTYGEFRFYIDGTLIDRIFLRNLDGGDLHTYGRLVSGFTVGEEHTFECKIFDTYGIDCGSLYETNYMLGDVVVSVAGTFRYMIPTCNDGVQNQGETGVDCGGPCAFCCKDMDKDGHYAYSPTCPTGDDCNDGDPTIFTGAAELCDGKDNNCNGQIDEGLSTDTDSDGHYTPGSCQIPNDDCDDSETTIYPGANEACDGKDNNCNDAVDENLFKDADQDGSVVPAGGCPVPGIYDCNDNDPKIFPGNTESCDEKDNNCNGAIDEGCSECGLTISW